MTLIDAMQPYLSRDGNVTLWVNPEAEEDNIHLFNATYAALVLRLQGVDDALPIFAQYIQYVRRCNEYKDSVPGLYRRSPGNYWRIISHDEMIGIASMSPDLASDIVSYGRSNLWCFDNRVPNHMTLTGWQLRFPADIAYYKARAVNVNLNLFDKLAWSVAAVLSSFSPYGSTSGKCLAYLASLDMCRKGLLCRTACRILWKRLAKVYGDLGGLYTIYFGPTHPLSVYSHQLPFSPE